MFFWRRKKKKTSPLGWGFDSLAKLTEALTKDLAAVLKRESLLLKALLLNFEMLIRIKNKYPRKFRKCIKKEDIEKVCDFADQAAEIKSNNTAIIIEEVENDRPK